MARRVMTIHILNLLPHQLHKKLSLTIKLNVWLYTLLTIAIALTIGVVLLNPLWTMYSPPFSMPKILPAITAPVDGPFYVWNAEYGYQWASKDPLSLWFHPFMSYLIMAMPRHIPGNIWFWLISIAFATGSIICIARLTPILGEVKANYARLLPLILLAPGGLGIATGNAEIPTLFFTLTLLLSVLRWQKWWLTIMCAALAILTKPNALYMVPVLLVYFAFGVLERNTKLWVQAIIGVVVLLIVWVIWIWFVDWKTGSPGTYWNLRMLTSQYTAQDAKGFFDNLVRSFLDSNDIRDRIRYLVALIIPIANLWIIGLIPLHHERDRYAMAAGNLTMLVIALYMGNPNKIIVYTTTLPGYFATHILFAEKLLAKVNLSKKLFSCIAIVVYAIYCLLMLLVYILGTPLGWYY